MYRPIQTANVDSGDQAGGGCGAGLMFEGLGNPLMAGLLSVEGGDEGISGITFVGRPRLPICKNLEVLFSPAEREVFEASLDISSFSVSLAFFLSFFLSFPFESEIERKRKKKRGGRER